MFSFLQVTSKGIICPKGEWIIDKPLILDQNQSLNIQAGTTLKFEKNGLIKTTSPIIAQGTLQQPISFMVQVPVQLLFYLLKINLNLSMLYLENYLI